MARGINQRTSLGLSASDMTDSSTMGRLIKRWGDALPFGAVGFEATRSTNQSLGVGNTAIAFDTILRDYEGWFSASTNPFDRMVVPDGCSGMYLMQSHLTSTNGRQLFTADGVAGGSGSVSPVNTTNLLATITVPNCQVGDKLFIDAGMQVAAVSPAGSGNWIISVTDSAGVHFPSGFVNQQLVSSTLNPDLLDSPVWTVINGGTNTISASIRQQTSPGPTFTWPGYTVKYTRVSGSAGLTTNTIKVNGVTVASSNLVTGAGAALEGLVWLNDADIVQNVMNCTVADTLNAQPATNTGIAVPRFAIGRISLL